MHNPTKPFVEIRVHVCTCSVARLHSWYASTFFFVCMVKLSSKSDYIKPCDYNLEYFIRYTEEMWGNNSSG